MKPVRNVAASVHQKLLNVAKHTSRPFNEIAQYYAIERWLYRLAKSDFRERLGIQPFQEPLWHKRGDALVHLHSHVPVCEKYGELLA